MAMITMDDRQQQILAEIRAKAGVELKAIEGLDTRSADLCASVLPVLRRWLDVPESNIRAAVASRFGSRWAGPFVPDLVRLWASESDAIVIHYLDIAIAAAVSVDSVDIVAETFLAPSEFERVRQSGVYTLVRLCRLSKTRRTALGLLARVLNGEVAIGLHFVSSIFTVKEGFVYDWIDRGTESTDSNMRSMCQREARRRRQAKPRRQRVYAYPPDKRRSVRSVETDMSSAEDIRVEWSQSLGPLPSLPGPDELALFDFNRWYCLHHGRAKFNLWIRLEDYTTIEMMLEAAE